MSVQARIVGGLGNQLFIVATVLATAARCGVPYALAKVSSSSCTARGTYWDTVFHRLQYVDVLPRPSQRYRETHPNQRLPLPVALTPDEHIVLDGYFQSPTYFADFDVNRVFALPENDDAHVTQRMHALRAAHPPTEQVVFVHVRRGDYVRCSHIHFLLPFEWYARALQHFDLERTLVLVFSDDLDGCRKGAVFQSLPHVEFVREPHDYLELFLMSRCDAAVIGNSTFSWWGAYLGQLKSKVVCPDIWFMDRFPQRQMRNPDTWIEEQVQL